MINANKPAFPGQVDKFGDTVIRVLSEGGLTKREYFAGLIMQALCASSSQHVAKHPRSELDLWQILSEFAVKAADALLLELSKEEK